MKRTGSNGLFVLFMAVFLVLSAFPALALDTSSSIQFRGTVLWLNVPEINARTGQELTGIDPLFCHGVSSSSDLFALLGGRFSLGVFALGAFDKNEAQGGSDYLGVGAGGFSSTLSWEFFDFLELGVRFGTTCGMIYLTTNNGPSNIAGYIGLEPAAIVAVNLWRFRIETGFVWGFDLLRNLSWLELGGPRVEVGVGFRF